MDQRGKRMIGVLAAVVALATGCATTTRMDTPDFLIGELRVTRHDGGDDLLSAGLGLEGLRAPTPPAVSAAETPTPAELRRRAIHANWRGIAHLHDPALAPLPVVPGREYSAFAQLPGARHPHRVLVQVPDNFDPRARCLVVAPASGSRGVYGAIAVAAPWALARGCAIAYTDKGAGTGFFDHDSGTGVALDGTRAVRGTARLEFDPGEIGAPAHAVSMKHAHSGDNPEADWGRHTLQAARFGLHALSLAFPQHAPFTAANTRILATGVSNGGGAALRASELDEEGLIDAVVVAAPNVLPPGVRPLYDFATEAALLQPCALLAQPGLVHLLPEGAWRAVALARCASLASAGHVAAGTPEAQARESLERLRAAGWSEGPLALGGLHLATDLWRAILATYAQSYARVDAAHPACGYGFAALDAGLAPRATTVAERATWASDATGIAPTANLAIVDARARGQDPGWSGLSCARALYTGTGAPSQALRASIEATRARARPRAAHVHIVHGADDSLIPVAFTSRPYVEAARAHGVAITYDEIPRAQHFDAFVALPQLGGRYVALLPHARAALDAAWARIAE